MNYELQVSGFKFWAIVAFLLSTFNLSAAEISTIQSFETKFNIQIITSDTFHSTYEMVKFEEVQNEAQINDYISNILIPEFDKYPVSYFENIGLKKILLCQKLYVEDQNRAAVPDPFKNTLLLALDSIYFKEYLIHVLHHELHHITEFALWQDMFYVWKKWERKNTKTFQYSNGSYEAYENQNINWYQINNPKTGFVNLYSTLSAEEDRCEIVALIMTDSERKYLQNFIETDKILKQKVNISLKTLTKISKEKLKYWKAKLNS